MILRRKTAEKIQKKFAKMVDKISQSEENTIIVLNIGRAESFIKTLKLVEAIDFYTADRMTSAIYEAEQDVYRRIKKQEDKKSRSPEIG